MLVVAPPQNFLVEFLMATLRDLIRLRTNGFMALPLRRPPATIGSATWYAVSHLVNGYPRVKLLVRQKAS